MTLLLVRDDMVGGPATAEIESRSWTWHTRCRKSTPLAAMPTT